MRPNPVDAYGAAVRAHGTPRSVERDVLMRANAALLRAVEDDAPAALAAALVANQKLWTAFAEDLAGAGNALPESLRARLLGIAVFVVRHTLAVARGEADPAVLVEINGTVLRGLDDAGGR